MPVVPSEVSDTGPWAIAAALIGLLWKWTPVLLDMHAEAKRRRQIEQAKLVQSDRRDERRRRDSSMPPTQMRAPSKMPSVDLAPPPRGEFDNAPTTDIKEILGEIEQAEKPPAKRPRGERSPRRGTHHDGEG